MTEEQALEQIKQALRTLGQAVSEDRKATADWKRDVERRFLQIELMLGSLDRPAK